MPSPLIIDPAATRWSVPSSTITEALADRPLLVVLHGLGASERDLLPIAPLLPPDFVVAALRAPISLVQGGYAWQPIGGQERPTPPLFDDPARAVLDWLDALHARHGSSGRSVSLLGFSQGAAMVSHLFRLQPARFRSGVFLSGFAGAFPLDSDRELARLRPPLFWGRGTADPVITGSSITFAEDFLGRHFTLTAHAYSGLGHAISREEIDDVAAFLRDTALD